MSKNVLHLQRLPELHSLGLDKGFTPTITPEPTCTLCTNTCKVTADEL